MPFKNVYFTGIIRDKQGAARCRRRSAIRPIRSCSSPNTARTPSRFGTMRSAPLGQDVLFDEKDVELGRNFPQQAVERVSCFRQMHRREATDAGRD